MNAVFWLHFNELFHLFQFEKPGRRENFDYPQMVKESVTKALADAKIDYTEIQQACCGYVSGIRFSIENHFCIVNSMFYYTGDSTSGQRALYEVGMTGIPVYNVNNNCSTGATALILAKQLIETGNNDCVLAVGFEKMQRGSLSLTVCNCSL